jgi:hypothetical protein
MSTCPDDDTLVALSRTTADPLELIGHVASCEACRLMVADAATVRVALSTSPVPRPGFVDEVMEALTLAAAEEAGRPVTVAGPASWLWSLVGGGLTAATALAAVASAGGAVPLPPGPAMLLGSLLAGVAGAAFTRDTRRT